MVHFQGYLLVVISLILSVIESGLSLRCWKCTSDFDATCRDHFNTTRILLNQRQMDSYSYGNLQPARNDPHMTECDEMRTKTHREFKVVCLKRVLIEPTGPNRVVRECRMVNHDLKVGACPDDVAASRPRNLQFCGTCENDGCNSASTSSILFIGLIPAVLLLLRK